MVQTRSQSKRRRKTSGSPKPTRRTPSKKTGGSKSRRATASPKKKQQQGVTQRGSQTPVKRRTPLKKKVSSSSSSKRKTPRQTRSTRQPPSAAVRSPLKNVINTAPRPRGRPSKNNRKTAPPLPPPSFVGGPSHTPLATKKPLTRRQVALSQTLPAFSRRLVTDVREGSAGESSVESSVVSSVTPSPAPVERRPPVQRLSQMPRQVFQNMQTPNFKNMLTASQKRKVTTGLNTLAEEKFSVIMCALNVLLMSLLMYDVLTGNFGREYRDAYLVVIGTVILESVATVALYVDPSLEAFAITGEALSNGVQLALFLRLTGNMTVLSGGLVIFAVVVALVYNVTQEQTWMARLTFYLPWFVITFFHLTLFQDSNRLKVVIACVAAACVADLFDFPDSYSSQKMSDACIVLFRMVAAYSLITYAMMETPNHDHKQLMFASAEAFLCGLFHFSRAADKNSQTTQPKAKEGTQTAPKVAKQNADAGASAGAGNARAEARANVRANANANGGGQQQAQPQATD